MSYFKEPISCLQSKGVSNSFGVDMGETVSSLVLLEFNQGGYYTQKIEGFYPFRKIKGKLLFVLDFGIIFGTKHNPFLYEIAPRPLIVPYRI